MHQTEWLISPGKPSDAFWAQYAALWRESQDRSPFESPGILRYFSERAGRKVWAFQYFQEGKLTGAALMKLEGKNLSFLSDMKSDANFFVFARRCVPDGWGRFFRLLLGEVRKNNWTLTLNHHPSWARYASALEEAMKESGMFLENLPYSVCPVLEKESPQVLFEHVNGMQELRIRVNRLKKRENAGFEVLTDDADLDPWVEEFCDAHTLRWANTPTPSGYQNPSSRKFLNECLRAWLADGLLVRFAIRVQDQRIGFVIGLREENSLIHHATTFHPEFSKQSPGKALIHFMAEWMSENGYSALDFGSGNESYKYTVTNTERPLHRIFVSGKYNIPFILKTKLIKSVRGNNRTYDLYQEKLKPAFRKLSRKLSKQPGEINPPAKAQRE